MSRAVIVLGGQTFACSPLPAMDSFAMQPRIAPMLMELVALAASLLADAGAEISEETNLSDFKLDKLDMATIGPAVMRICKAMPSSELRAITVELLQTATINGALLQPQFDLVMQGRMLDTWKLLFHAAKVNYPDFFALFGKGADPPVAAPASSSPSPTP